jgi:hypothetical protein
MHNEFNYKFFDGCKNAVVKNIFFGAISNVKDVEHLAYNLVSGKVVNK